MIRKLQLLVNALGASVVFLALVPAVSAQCGPSIAKPAAFHSLAPGRAGHLQLASAIGARRLDVQDDRAGSGFEPIVGLWKIDFEDPSHAYSDKGYAVWHSDYTEFQNSGKAPSTGAVCQGVWEKVGRDTYRLNHYAMGFSDGVHYDGLVQIRELITVEPSRNAFSGTFSLKIYDPKTHAFEVELNGTITATRVTINSNIDSQ